MKILEIALYSFLILFVFMSCSPERNEETADSSSERIEITEDLVFALDISSSMLAQDFEPNRLEVTTSILKKVIREKSDNQRISVVVYSGEATILCPLTTDTTLLLKRLNLIDVNLITTRSIKDGTGIGKGIIFGLYELSRGESKQGRIFIMTDGLDNIDEYPIDLAANLAKEYGVQINSIGIGCEGIALAPTVRKGVKGFLYRKQDVKIDEDIPKNIGEETKGKYHRVTCNADFNKLRESDIFSVSKQTPTNSIDLKDISKMKNDTIWQAVQPESEMVFEKIVSESLKRFTEIDFLWDKNSKMKK